MEKYILAIDVGTTSLRTLAYNTSNHTICNVNSAKVQSFYPEPFCVEQDAEQIAKDVKTCLAKTIKNLSTEQIVGVGLTNQRETIVIWNKTTGKPIYNALVWQDKRTSELCENYKNNSKIGKMIQQKTGLLCDAYFSASKLSWLLNNVPMAKKLIKSHNLCAGTLDSYIAFYLTNGTSFVTDHTNVSRTLLYNIHTKDYDEELLDLWKIPREILPNIINNDEIIGKINIDYKEINFGGMIGDQQSSLFGQGCFDIGAGKTTYGTGAFILFNIGDKPIISNNNLLTTVAWQTKENTAYAMECSMYSAGACVTWMKDSLGLISSPTDTEIALKNTTSCNGVTFIPALAGLGAPFWKNDVKAGFYGLTSATKKEHLIRAVLCGIAHNVKCAYDSVVQSSKIPLKEFKVDGGMTANNTFLQIQADLLNTPVICSQESESTSLGAVFMCGLAFGFYKSINDLKNVYKTRCIFQPTCNNTLNNEYSCWLEIAKNI